MKNKEEATTQIAMSLYLLVEALPYIESDRIRNLFLKELENIDNAMGVITEEKPMDEKDIDSEYNEVDQALRDLFSSRNISPEDTLSHIAVFFMTLCKFINLDNSQFDALCRYMEKTYKGETT